MSQTPWGDASQLRTRMLRPGPGHSPKLVAQNQRERLLAATVGPPKPSEGRCQRGQCCSRSPRGLLGLAQPPRVGGIKRERLRQAHHNLRDRTKPGRVNRNASEPRLQLDALQDRRQRIAHDTQLRGLGCCLSL
jgi:hypothetical protein